MSDDDYKIGYGKPPRHSQFKKGVSGNPAGRRRRSTSFDALLEQQLNEKVLINRGGRKVRISKREALIWKLMSDALSGKPRSLDFFLKYLQQSGRPDPFGSEFYDDRILAELAATLIPAADDIPEEG